MSVDYPHTLPGQLSNEIKKKLSLGCHNAALKKTA